MDGGAPPRSIDRLRHSLHSPEALRLSARRYAFPCTLTCRYAPSPVHHQRENLPVPVPVQSYRHQLDPGTGSSPAGDWDLAARPANGESHPKPPTGRNSVLPDVRVGDPPSSAVCAPRPPSFWKPEC